MDLKPFYRQRGYEFLEKLPKHPFVCKQIMENFPIRLADKRNGQVRSRPRACVCGRLADCLFDPH